jgi:hypothetical protein
MVGDTASKGRGAHLFGVVSREAVARSECASLKALQRSDEATSLCS